MKKIVAGFCALCDRVSTATGRVVMWLSALIVAVMIWEVVSRYVFDKPTLWANELSLWVAGIFYLLAGLYAMRERAHIRVTILYDILSPRARRALDGLAALVVMLFAVALIVGAWETTWKTVMRWEKFGTAWDPPIPATVKPLILIAVALIAAQALANFASDFIRQEKEEEDSSKESGPSGVD